MTSFPEDTTELEGDELYGFGFEAGQADRISGDFSYPIAADGEAYALGYARGARD